MLINVAAPILDRAKAPVMQGEEVLTVRHVLLAAIDNQTPDDARASTVAKWDLHRLGMKIHEADEVELTAAQVALLQGRVAAIASPLLLGRIMEATEAKPAAAEKAN